MGSQGMSRSDFEKKVDWLNQAIGLKDAMDIRIGRLPRGSIHQLGLAQALVHDPELLVLDEPSANLDAISRKKLKNLLIEFAAKGKTVLISSHILSEVEELCTRVIFINKGKVVQQGKTEDLLGTGGGYLIRFKTPAEMPSQLSRLGSVVPDPEAGVTAFETRTDTEKDLVVKALVENGIAIQSLELRQKTLEEVFMELLEERMLENYLTKIMAT
jgi:ABC-type multidrug transport system ATPase subunit